MQEKYVQEKSKKNVPKANYDEDLRRRKALFLKVFKAAEKCYGRSTKRLAGEGWDLDWQLLFAVMMSAQTRDETAVSSAEELYRKYKTLEEISSADENDILRVIQRVNYNRTKARNIVASAKVLISSHGGKVPSSIHKLVELPGVGRKTANLILGELHQMNAICVDTHVHRISNVLGIVHTKTPFQTETELMKVAPKKYWNKINRLFVLWGKEVPGRDKNRLLSRIGLEEKKQNICAENMV